MATARKYVMESQFQGEPKRSDLKIVEEDLPPLNDGGRERRLQCCSYSCLYSYSFRISNWSSLVISWSLHEVIIELKLRIAFYMTVYRPYMRRFGPGHTMIGTQVAKFVPNCLRKLLTIVGPLPVASVCVLCVQDACLGWFQKLLYKFVGVFFLLISTPACRAGLLSGQYMQL